MDADPHAGLALAPRIGSTRWARTDPASLRQSEEQFAANAGGAAGPQVDPAEICEAIRFILDAPSIPAK